MVNQTILKEIDKTIKDIWVYDICNDYAKGDLIKEASLQCALYYHIREKLGTLLANNNLYIYPEFYFSDLKFFADIAIVEMDMSKEENYLAQKMNKVVAIIELKYDGGNSKSTEEYIKSDISKLKQYIDYFEYDCQYYLGIIYETDCSCLNWMDKRSTNNWANGRVTELNAGMYEGKMYFEVNSYNNINYQHRLEECNNIMW